MLLLLFNLVRGFGKGFPNLDPIPAVEVKPISLQVLNQIERSVEHYEELYKRKPNPLIAYELSQGLLKEGGTIIEGTS